MSASTELSSKRRSEVQREDDVRSWLESINPRYGKYAPGFAEQGASLDEIDLGLDDDVIADIERELSTRGAKKQELKRIMGEVRERTDRHKRSGEVTFSPMVAANNEGVAASTTTTTTRVVSRSAERK